jgi:hypothetical protein
MFLHYTGLPKRSSTITQPAQPTMAVVKDCYTLDDVTSYAREHFNAVFGSISHSQAYKFELQQCRFWSGKSRMRMADVLYVGFEKSQKHNIHMWAHSNGSEVEYLTRNPGEPITSTLEGPFPTTRGQDKLDIVQGPFSHILVEKAGNPRAKHTASIRSLARRRFDLLVHVAFLVAGKIDHIRNLKKVDLLEEIKDLCFHLHSNSAAGEFTAGTMSTRESGSKRAATSENESLDHPVQSMLFLHTCGCIC